MLQSNVRRRDFLKTLAAGAAVGCGGARDDSRARPNIILIMADDMGFSDVGCYGSEIDTPNVDRLAAGGIRFTQFYNTARCCPTRASLLTGMYPHQAGIGHMTQDRGRPSYRGDLSPHCVTIAEALRPAGYRTGISGKWHVTWPKLDDPHNWPLQRGFDRYFGTLTGGGNFFNPSMLIRDNTPITAEDDFYYTRAVTDHAVSFIDEFSQGGDPFFLYVAYTAPHWPLHALPQDIAKYEGRFLKGWDAVRAGRRQRLIDMGILDARWPLAPRDERVPAWEDAPNKEWEARRMAVYAAQIDRMDQGVGRIMSKVREIGAEEDTLIMFLADNGGCAEIIRPESKNPVFPTETHDGRPVRRGNLPSIMPGPENTYQSYGVGWANASNSPFRLYKHWVHEGGIATPLVACWPAGIEQRNAITHQQGHVIDLLATCVDVAGAEYPSTNDGNEILPLEGRSLAPIFAGGERDPHEAIFWEHEGNRAVRRGDWKLVSRYPEGWELYDLRADRTETRDLAGDHPGKAGELKALYDRWAERAGVAGWDEITGTG